MTALAELHREHLALTAHAASLEPVEPVDAQTAERLRRSLILFETRLGEHLAHEEPFLADLRAAPSGSPLRLAGEARTKEALALAEACHSCIARWATPAVIERDPRGFASTWAVLRSSLIRLFAREEGEVYPLTAGSGWTPQPVQAPLPTGIPEIDEDHDGFFANIGALRAALCGGKQVVDGTDVAELAIYAERHFAREEALMEATNYPALEDHRNEHHRARGILMGFRNDHLDGRRVDTIAVLLFLESWLISHIAHTDQRMSDHLHACGRTHG